MNQNWMTLFLATLFVCVIITGFFYITISEDNINSKKLVIQDMFWNSKSSFVIENAEEFAKKNIPVVHVPQVNCKAIATGEPTEIKKGLDYQKAHKYYDSAIPDKNYTSVSSNCSNFIKTRHYATMPLSEEEAYFPLAYAVMIYRDMNQIERLLRAIYRPQNFYCFHVDVKASPEIRNGIKSISACFNNVFISSRSINVKWGRFSVLEPELVCMEDLWKYKWKFFINLTGQEFPLQTNLAIVKILKALKGANIMEGTIKRHHKERTDFIHKGLKLMRKKPKPKPTIPVVIATGAVHVIVKREYVDYILHNKTAFIFRKWVKNTGHPEEIFYSSLNHSPKLNVPGGYLGVPETDHIDSKNPIYPYLGRFKNWGGWPFNWTCSGVRVRGVCVFGLEDLQLLVNRKELFTNKHFADYQPLTYDCLEEYHFNRTRDEVLGLRNFNTTFYENLDVTRNHVGGLS